MLDDKTFERFFSKVDIPEDSDLCWVWLAGTYWDGYGMFKINGVYRGAHRVSYEHFYGPIPDGLIVRHKVCDNPRCVNPRHLKLGTQKDNMDDKVSKGFQSRGESGNSVLTESNVLLIRELHEEFEMTQQKIADLLGIGKSQVQRILSRENWKHL